MSRYYKGNGLCGPTIHICTTKRGVPGPKYALPSLTGYEGHDTEANKTRAPAYSLKFRLRASDTIRSPGPAAYLPVAKQTRVGNDGTPAYSLGNRHRDNAKNESPGPGAYAPERYYFPRSRTAPEYSMGQRYKYRRNDHMYNPAPNAYTLPSRIGAPHPDLKQAPAYHLTFRERKGFAYDNAKTPGPAAYPLSDQNKIKLSSPEFSIGVRCQAPGDKTIKPSPASHKVELCPHTTNSTKKGAPSFSFGRRHHEYTVAPIFADCEIICLPQPQPAC